MYNENIDITNKLTTNKGQFMNKTIIKIRKFFNKKTNLISNILIVLIISTIISTSFYFFAIKLNTPKQSTPPRQNHPPHLVDKDDEDKDPIIQFMNTQISKLPQPTEELIHLATADASKIKDEDANFGRYIENPEDVWKGDRKNEA